MDIDLELFTREFHQIRRDARHEDCENQRHHTKEKCAGTHGSPKKIVQFFLITLLSVTREHRNEHRTDSGENEDLQQKITRPECGDVGIYDTDLSTRTEGGSKNVITYETRKGCTKLRDR